MKLVTSAYCVCGRCRRRLAVGEECHARRAPRKNGVITICHGCHVDEVLEEIVALCAEKVRGVLRRGLRKYPLVEYDAIINKPDHMDHLRAHIAAHEMGDTSETHLDNGATRMLLQSLMEDGSCSPVPRNHQGDTR